MKKTAVNSLNQNIKILKQKFNVSEVGEIIGINYLLATIQAMENMKGGSIFSDEDYFEHTTKGDEYNHKEFEEESEEDDEFEYIGHTGLSKKFLLKRVKRLNVLLGDFNNPKEPLTNSEIIFKRRKELEYLLMEFRMDGKIDWLNKNGFYSFYRSVEEGFVTYGELGKRVEDMMRIENKLINSK